MSPPCFVLHGGLRFTKLNGWGEKIHEDYEICCKWTNAAVVVPSCCPARWGEGVREVKWDRKPWQCRGNSMRGFAAPGTHLFLRRVPVDTVSCWHTVKLDCGKHHHAETDKRKNRRCFYFQILVGTAEEGRNCRLNNVFVFMFFKTLVNLWQMFLKLYLILNGSYSFFSPRTGTWSYSVNKELLVKYGL